MNRFLSLCLQNERCNKIPGAHENGVDAYLPPALRTVSKIVARNFCDGTSAARDELWCFDRRRPQSFVNLLHLMLVSTKLNKNSRLSANMLLIFGKTQSITVAHELRCPQDCSKSDPVQPLHVAAFLSTENLTVVAFPQHAHATILTFPPVRPKVAIKSYSPNTICEIAYFGLNGLLSSNS